MKEKLPGWAFLKGLGYLYLAFLAVISVVLWDRNKRLPMHPVDLSGKTIIVTGASAGIGKESARLFASWNASVIMAVRNETKGEAVLQDMKRSTGNPRVEMWRLNLSNLESVNAFAERFLASRRPLHVLLANAGVMAWERVVTRDGHELTHQSNHLGHFLLTTRLLPRLQASAPARVVQVASEAHYMGDAGLLDDLEMEKAPYNGMAAFANSKLLNVLYANELTRRYQHTGVTANSVHPGLVTSEFHRNIPSLLAPLHKLVFGLFARDEVQGALTQVYAATHPSLEGVGGLYLESCKAVAMSAKARNATLASLAWQRSEADVARFFARRGALISVGPVAGEGVLGANISIAYR